jgi:Polyketide cyclase / dehydrase and lipid transport
MDRGAQLLASGEMEPVEGTAEVDVPVDELWRCFSRPDWWPRWNASFFWVHNRSLEPGRQLLWAFHPIRPRYLYKLPAAARIVDVEPERRATWEVTAFPGMYARHTYSLEGRGDGSSAFGSWEQAMGRGFRLTRRFWIAHFRFVCDRSLQGARRLEEIYRREGRLDDATLPRR